MDLKGSGGRMKRDVASVIGLVILAWVVGTGCQRSATHSSVQTPGRVAKSGLEAKAQRPGGETGREREKEREQRARRGHGGRTARGCG